MLRRHGGELELDMEAWVHLQNYVDVALAIGIEGGGVTETSGFVTLSRSAADNSVS